MTGYGAGKTLAAGRELQVELRAVNHRFLDTRVRMPNALGGLVGVVEEAVVVVRRRLVVRRHRRPPPTGNSTAGCRGVHQRRWISSSHSDADTS